MRIANVPVMPTVRATMVIVITADPPQPETGRRCQLQHLQHGHRRCQTVGFSVCFWGGGVWGRRVCEDRGGGSAAQIDLIGSPTDIERAGCEGLGERGGTRSAAARRAQREQWIRTTG